MGEFFKGWRRKIGLVTLALAMVLMCGWFRSYSASDWLSIHTGEFTIQSLASMDCSLVWGGIDGRESKFVPNIHMWHTGEAISIDDDRLHKDGRQRFRWLGFEVVDFYEEYYVGDMQPPLATVRSTIWIFPYWSLVLPLTLLSAWLILMKPRKAKGSP